MDIFPERGGLTFAFFGVSLYALQHALNGLDQKGRIRAYGRALIALCEVCRFRHGVRVDERQFAGSPASRNHPVESLGEPRGGEPRRSAQRHRKIIRPDKNAVDAVQSGDPSICSSAPAVSHCGMRIVRWFVAVK